MIKKFILFYLHLVLITNYMQGQNLNDLDSRNGFKEFKLGNPYSKWSKDLVFDSYSEDGEKKYLYTGSCCDKIFNYEIQQIQLGVTNNKISTICITTRKFRENNGKIIDWRTDDFMEINKNFEYLFGEPSYIKKPDNGEVVFLWYGKRVNLISCYKFTGYADYQVIIIGSNLSIEKKIKDGF
jgi:hypothetical protein